MVTVSKVLRGRHDIGLQTKERSGSFLVVSDIGGAVLTPLMGWIAMHTHSAAAAYQVALNSYVCTAS